MSGAGVTVDDDSPHAPEEGIAWAESYGFTLFEFDEGVVGLARLEVRPGEGSMDAGLDFHLPDNGLVAVRQIRPLPQDPAELEVEGITFEMIEPLRRWKLSYDGPSHTLDDARDAEKHDAWHDSRLERLIVDLTFEASHEPLEPGAAGELRHFEQAGTLKGEIWVSGDHYPVSGVAIRERTWGKRDLEGLTARRRVRVGFPDGSAYSFSRSCSGDGDVQSGWWHRSGAATLATDQRLESETDDGGVHHTKVALTLGAGGGDASTLEGHMRRVAPFPSMRNQQKALVCEGVGPFELAGNRGFGLAEYLHMLDEDGRPVVPV